MSGSLAFRWRKPSPAIKMRWRALDSTSFSAISNGASTGFLAALIGPKGQDGADFSTYDPGDITLTFENGLI
jgi:hypothetical protein